MGVSDAGKTTLMDVLAGRKTGGYIEGDIRISGYPKKQETFARIFGYCEQNDIHSPHVMVYESLVYSAWLSLSTDDEGTRKMFVDEVMELVELNPLRDALVGRNKDLIAELSVPRSGTQDLYFPTRYSQSFSVQCIACLWKQRLSYWRNPPYTAVRFAFTTFITIMFGTMFWDIGRKRKTQQELFNAMGSMYAASFFLGVQNASAVQPVVDIERTVFYRERAAGMYSALPYTCAQ
nr:pleiotropic drug resistance protein 1-like [Tanacetum cinerariifolium]